MTATTPTSKAQVAWAPQPGSQVAFLTCPIFELLYEGTRGPGKTDALLMDFGRDVGRGHGEAWRGILFRQTYPQLADVIAKTKKWFWHIWPNAQYNEAQHFWRWPSGEMLLLRQFKSDDDYWNYHGHEYPWIGWEELCNWPTYTGYKRMMSCCRSSEQGVPKRYRATTNPYGPGHNWVKHRFELPARRGKPIVDAVDEDGNPEPPRVAIHGNIHENKIMLEADPGYIDRIRAAARNEAERKAWIEGSWDIVAGGMFDDVWEPAHHVVPAFDIPDSWTVFRSFDWGSSAPFSVGWWAKSDGSDVLLRDGTWRSTVRGDLFRVGEWYGWNKKPNEGLRMLATDVAKGIVEREVKWGWRNGNLTRVQAGPADSAIFNWENGVSIADDMAKRVRLDNGQVYQGVHFTPADKRPGSRKTGWEQMRKVLKQALPNENGAPREKPGLFVFESCEEFQRTVPVLPRDEKDPDDVDTEAEDHIADETRYTIRGAEGGVSGGKVTGMH